MSSPNSKGIPPSVFTASLLNAAMLQLPSVLAKRGDHKLALARDLAIEYESVMAVDDRRTLDDSITS